jgi:hypothetical protein
MLRYLGHSPFGVCNRPHHLQRFPNQRSAGDLRRFQVSIILSEQPSRVATVITGYPEVIHLDEKPAPQGEQVTYNPVFQQLRLGWRKVTCPDSRPYVHVEWRQRQTRSSSRRFSAACEYDDDLVRKIRAVQQGSKTGVFANLVQARIG